MTCSEIKKSQLKRLTSINADIAEVVHKSGFCVYSFMKQIKFVTLDYCERQIYSKTVVYVRDSHCGFFIVFNGIMRQRSAALYRHAV